VEILEIVGAMSWESTLLIFR